MKNRRIRKWEQSKFQQRVLKGLVCILVRADEGADFLQGGALLGKHDQIRGGLLCFYPRHLCITAPVIAETRSKAFPVFAFTYIFDCLYLRIHFLKTKRKYEATIKMEVSETGNPKFQLIFPERKKGKKNEE